MIRDKKKVTSYDELWLTKNNISFITAEAIHVGLTWLCTRIDFRWKVCEKRSSMCAQITRTAFETHITSKWFHVVFSEICTSVIISLLLFINFFFYVNLFVVFDGRQFVFHGILYAYTRLQLCHIQYMCV